MTECYCKDNALYNGSKGKRPPDTVKSHSHVSQQHGKRNSGTGQDNADDTAEFGHSKTGQSTDGHQLNGHKRLAETNDDQVMYGNSK